MLCLAASATIHFGKAAGRNSLISTLSETRQLHFIGHWGVPTSANMVQLTPAGTIDQSGTYPLQPIYKVNKLTAVPPKPRASVVVSGRSSVEEQFTRPSSY
jgi:hypothetical protein